MSSESSPIVVPINCTWPGEGGYYFWYTAKVNVWGEVNDHVMTLHCSDPYDEDWNTGTLYGGGFVDAIGYFWDPGSTVGTSDRKADNQSTGNSVSSGIELYKQQLRDMGYCAQSSNPLAWCVGGVAQQNYTKEYQKFGGSGNTYTRTLTDAELSSIMDLPAIGIATRYRDNNTNQAVTHMVGYTLPFRELLGGNVPWSVYYPDSRNNDTPINFSCNRSVTDGSGHIGGLWIYDGPNEYHDVTTDTAWNYYNGEHQNSIVFGELA